MNSLSVNPKGEILISFSLVLENQTSSGLLLLAADCSLRWSKLFRDTENDDYFSSIGAVFAGNNIILASVAIASADDHILPRKENFVFTQVGTSGDLITAKLLSIDRNNVATAGVGSAGYFKVHDSRLYMQALLSGDYTRPGSEPLFYTPILDTNLVLLKSEQFKNSTGTLGANTRYAVDKIHNQMRLTSEPFFDSTIFVAIFNAGLPQWKRAYKLPFQVLNTDLSVTEHPLKQGSFKFVYAKKNSSKFYLQRLQANLPSQGDCMSTQDTAAINVTSTPFFYKTFSWHEVQDGPFETTIEKITISAPAVTYSPSCTLMVSCNTIQLIGPTDLCASDSLYDFVVRRSNGCTNEVQWQIDTNCTRSIEMVNDTTLRVRFKPGKSVLIKAVLAGCTILSDSLRVHVRNALSPLLLNENRIICSELSFDMALPNGYKQYMWNGFPSQYITISAPGEYAAAALDYCGNWHIDTLRVTVDSIEFKPKSPQYTKCQDDTLDLTAPPGYLQYQWLPHIGAEPFNDRLKVSARQPSSYYVNFLSPAGCAYTEKFTVLIDSTPTLTLPADTSICQGDALQIQPVQNFEKYVWNTGDTTRRLWVHSPGTYILTATSMGLCAATDTFSLLMPKPTPHEFLPTEVSFCMSETVTLQPNSTEFISYTWSTGSKQSSIVVQKAGRYGLEVTARNGCKAKEYINVLQKECASAIFFPDAFTPNGDHRNDVFKATCFQMPASFRLAVYDRWGTLIFRTSDPLTGWAGSNNGIKQATGTYVWNCVYQFSGGPLQSTKGTVLLIR